MNRGHVAKEEKCVVNVEILGLKGHDDIGVRKAAGYLFTLLQLKKTCIMFTCVQWAMCTLKVTIII